MKILELKDYPTDMDELCKELDKVGMQYEKRVHPVTVHESVKHLIGFEPAGEWQVLITTKGALYSVVRGGKWVLWNPTERSDYETRTIHDECASFSLDELIDWFSSQESWIQPSSTADHYDTFLRFEQMPDGVWWADLSGGIYHRLTQATARGATALDALVALAIAVKGQL